MGFAEKEEKEKGHRVSHGLSISYFDINQLELAFINRILRGEKTDVPDLVEVGNSPRVLKIQKKNLEAILMRHGKEKREGQLEGELKRILSGAKIFSIFPHKR
jgi:hypothetical protein